MSSDDGAFEVTFACRNCGGEWDETYPARTRVDGGTMGRVHYRNVDCEEFVTSKCDCCGVIECPTCGLRGDVYVDSRQPVGGD